MVRKSSVSIWIHPLSDISPHQVLVFHGEDHLQRGTSLASAVAPVAPHQGKAVLPHGAAGARPCTGGASQGEGTESLLAASGCAGIKLFLISVDLGHTLLRITLVCLACELSLVAVKNNRRCKNDLFSSYTSWLLNSSAPPKKKSTSEALSSWSEGHVWVSPEMHGAITGTFKNQIDWLLDIN